MIVKQELQDNESGSQVEEIGLSNYWPEQDIEWDVSQAFNTKGIICLYLLFILFYIMFIIFFILFIMLYLFIYLNKIYYQ